MDKIDFKQPLTPVLLFLFAKAYGLEKARIRICDGMAVSYFPTLDAVCRTKDKMVIDVSAEPFFEFDELSQADTGILYTLDHNAEVEVAGWLEAHAATIDTDE